MIKTNLNNKMFNQINTVNLSQKSSKYLSEAETIAKAILDDQNCIEAQTRQYMQCKLQDDATNEESIAKLYTVQSEYMAYKIIGNINVKTYNGGLNMVKKIDSDVQNMNKVSLEINNIYSSCALKDDLLTSAIFNIEKKLKSCKEYILLDISEKTKLLSGLKQANANILQAIEEKNKIITNSLVEQHNEFIRLQDEIVKYAEECEALEFENEKMKKTYSEYIEKNENITLDITKITEENKKMQEKINEAEKQYLMEIKNHRNISDETLMKTNVVNVKIQENDVILAKLQDSIASLKENEKIYQEKILVKQSKLDDEMNQLKKKYYSEIYDPDLLKIDWDVNTNSEKTLSDQINKMEQYIRNIDNLNLEQNIMCLEMENKTIGNKICILNDDIQLENQKMGDLDDEADITEMQERLQDEFEINCERYRNIISDLKMNIQDIKDKSQARLIEAKSIHEKNCSNMNNSLEAIINCIEETKAKITKYNDDLAVVTMEGDVLERKIENLKETKNIIYQQPQVPYSPPIKLQKRNDFLSDSSFDGPSAKDILLRKLQKKKK